MDNQDKYYDIILTDIKFHSVKPTNQRSFMAEMLRLTKSRNKSGRVYGNTPEILDGKPCFPVPMTKDLTEELNLAKRLGKQVRFFMPKDGLPMFFATDAIEKIKAEKKKWKRFVARLTGL